MPLNYEDKEVERLLQQMYRGGFTQEGVNEIYRRLGLGQAPTVPASLIGARPGSGRAAIFTIGPNGQRHRTQEEADFFNRFASQAQDPYREYGVGNYLGLAGMIVGGAGAAGAFGGAGAAGGGAAGGSNLGIFANGGANGLAGLGGGNAGALAASGAITGGAGIGGNAAGAFGSGGLGRAINSVSGVSGGNSMGWDWGNILETGGQLLGGYLENRGSRDAARASEAGAAAALAENRRQYDTSRADMMPWIEAGRGALGRLQDPNAFTASPSYNFVRGEGMRGIENSFAARGGAASGNALRALSEFNAGLASQEHNNWWNQQAGLAGVGQTTAQNLGTFGANAANNAGNLMQNQANARASGIAGQTNAWTNTLQNLLAQLGRRNQQTG